MTAADAGGGSIVVGVATRSTIHGRIDRWGEHGIDEFLKIQEFRSRERDRKSTRAQIRFHFTTCLPRSRARPLALPQPHLPSSTHFKASRIESMCVFEAHPKLW
jgi:hypothetical protein